MTSLREIEPAFCEDRLRSSGSPCPHRAVTIRWGKLYCSYHDPERLRTRRQTAEDKPTLRNRILWLLEHYGRPMTSAELAEAAGYQKPQARKECVRLRRAGKIALMSGRRGVQRGGADPRAYRYGLPEWLKTGPSGPKAERKIETVPTPPPGEIVLGWRIE